MGVPADLADLAASGLLSRGRAWPGPARSRACRPPPRDGDVPVAGYVAGRFGPEVVDRLVDPLLGGVYAGRSEDLSFEATLPGLAQASRDRASLAEAAASLLPPAGGRRPRRGPGSAGRPRGRRCSPRWPAASARCRPRWRRRPARELRTGAMVRELARTAAGWRLTVGSAHAPEYLDADAVILALPGRPASRLLAGVPGAAAAAAALAEIEYASMAIVTLAYPACRVPPAAGAAAGTWCPAVDGRAGQGGHVLAR